MARRFFDLKSALNTVASHDDNHAFEFIFESFYEKLTRVALYYLGRQSAAEDAIADVFFKLWQNRKKLAKVESVENYLFTMTKNQCLSLLRNSKKIVYTEDHQNDALQISIENPESDFISEEFIAYYDKKVNELPAKCKLVYLMVKEDGLKYKEVATLLNISPKTVENQMSKAIGHIRKCLASYQNYHARKIFSENLK
jgi:RNA polymerase sigma-70 factor (ECF subfamily)